MSTHNMFLWRNKKNLTTVCLKKAPYLELWAAVFIFARICSDSLPLMDHLCIR